MNVGSLVSSCLPATPAVSTWYPLYPLYKRPVPATISPLTLSSLHDAGLVCCPHCGNHAVSTVHSVHLSVSSCPPCPPQYLIMSTVCVHLSRDHFCVHLSIPSCVHLRHSALTGTPHPGSCVAPPGDQPLAATSTSRQHTWHVGWRGLVGI